MKTLVEKVQFSLEKCKIADQKILIISPDGHVLFKSSKIQELYKNTLIQSITVLLVGTWRAAQELGTLSFFENDNFKLTYSDSNRGVAVENLKFQTKEYIAALIYDSEINPAKLRNQFKQALEVLLAMDAELLQEPAAKKESPFSNLSDDEINFAFDAIRI